MTNYFIIGVDADDRHKKNPELSKYLETQIQEHDISLVAEDTNKEVAKSYKGKTSLTKKVCKELKVKYIPCEPDSEECKRIGYSDEIKNNRQILENIIAEKLEKNEDVSKEIEKIRPFLSIRELVWYRKTNSTALEEKHKNVLFICDTKHLHFDTFPNLLKNRANNVHIIDTQWGDKQNVFVKILNWVT